MQIVVAHNNTDFDSLASQFAVTRLYPGTRMVTSGSLTPNIREFLTLYRNSLPLVDVRYADAETIKHIFIVDCQRLERLDDAIGKLIAQKKVTHTVFDHHEPDPDGLLSSARADSIVRSSGSCVSLLVEKLMEQKIKLEAHEATLLLTGVYEDTGCLTYAGTTELDARVVAYLLSQGADLQQVNNFITPRLGSAQTELFQTLVTNVEIVTVSGAKLALAQARCDNYVEGLATLTRRLLEVCSTNAAITVVWMRDRAHIVGRSDSPYIDVRAVMKLYGGGGHHGAASAVAKNEDLSAIVGEIKKQILDNAKPEQVAAELMATPVRTVRPDVEIDEAGKVMLRYGLDGLVVMDGDTVCGVISRRDVDKALHHKLGHAPVRGFMSAPVISLPPDAPLSKVQELMYQHDIGRLPVIDRSGVLVGIITRKELLTSLFGADATTTGAPVVSVRRRRIDFREYLTELDQANQWLFQIIGQLAESSGMAAYAVGGCVRDLYMRRPNFDLDIVVEGSAIHLAETLEQAYPGRFRLIARHERFITATLAFVADTVREVDLSTARIEFYEKPAALPTVEASELEQDLFRRDFTINALALSLNKQEFGFAVDFFGGVADIDNHLIRVLHSFSFIEDPTRIIRAARFAARFNFIFEENTRLQAERAIAMGIFDNLGGARLKEELRLILELPQRLRALDFLNSLGGGLRYLHSGLGFDEKVRSSLRRAERLLARNPLERDWIVYLAVLLAPLTRSEAHAVMERLALANDERHWIDTGLTLLDELSGERDKPPARSAIYGRLQGHAAQSLAIAASVATPGSQARRWIKLYLDELRLVRPVLSGKDLLRLGFPQGPEIKEALQKLHVARLDGVVETPAQEFEFIKKHYPQFSGV